MTGQLMMKIAGKGPGFFRRLTGKSLKDHHFGIKALDDASSYWDDIAIQIGPNRKGYEHAQGMASRYRKSRDGMIDGIPKEQKAIRNTRLATGGGVLGAGILAAALGKKSDPQGKTTMKSVT